MVFPKARLVVSAMLFLAWIGFLAYLVAHTRDPVILSRPQLAVSSVVIVATVVRIRIITRRATRRESIENSPNRRWTSSASHGAMRTACCPAPKLKIDGLSQIGRAQGWRGTGDYILALTKRTGTEAYEVTPVPLSPGYIPMYVTVELEKIGPENMKVMELLLKIEPNTTPMSDARPFHDGMRVRNVPRREAEDVKKKLEKVQAKVRLIDGEYRIYLATPDALEQLEDLKPK